MKEIVVKDVLGPNVKPEDAVVLKNMMNIYLENNVILNFKDIKEVSCTFFATLLTDLICKKGREYITDHLKVKNLTNMKAFNRILLGTSSC